MEHPGRVPNLPIWGNAKFAELRNKEMERRNIPEGSRFADIGQRKVCRLEQ